MKFTAFIISSILATPVPYYATEVDSAGQEKSADSYKQAYGTQEQGVDGTKATYGDVRAIGDNKQAYSAQEQVSGENKAAYGDVRAIGDNKQVHGDARAINNKQAYSPQEQVSGEMEFAYGNVKIIDEEKAGNSDKRAYITGEKRSGENKAAYENVESVGDVRSIDENMQVDIDYIEEWDPVAIEEEWESSDEETYLEAKSGNQAYSSGKVQDWNGSNRKGNNGCKDMSRNGQDIRRQIALYQFMGFGQKPRH
ncbi:hypothetical protein DSO57_1038822 [Entomophthora muscae]|uniref:Uncharacterized protein n=1 Tax=Entomophthora muscae TaxID=34485 RepID=A0ACC2TK97_9FUNG|nr:hypothetical protein DSO57_1038822 [Entomophthora muscae]